MALMPDPNRNTKIQVLLSLLVRLTSAAVPCEDGTLYFSSCTYLDALADVAMRFTSAVAEKAMCWLQDYKMGLQWTTQLCCLSYHPPRKREGLSF